MARACLLACVCACVVAGVFGQVATLCRPNERLLSCGGCQKTCSDPAPACAAVCRTGCYCEDDQVRNATGHCIKLADCPPTSAALKQDTTEPRPDCPANEEYRFCEPCNKTCDNPNPVCPAQCARGCFCKGDLVRDVDGNCVLYQNCSKFNKNETSNYVKPLLPPAKPNCAPGHVYKDCEPCEKTCFNPNPVCPAQCEKGCFCEDGLVRSPSGQCVKLEDCPKANYVKPLLPPTKPNCAPGQVFKDCEPCEKTCFNPNPVCPAQCEKGCFCEDGLVRSPSGQCVKLEDCPKAEMTFVNDPSIEDCAADEEFLSCGWCEPSCWAPAPLCPRVCTRGCLCRPPLVRHYSGHCVQPKDCEPQTCSSPTEEYVCRYGCEIVCGGTNTCPDRPRRCQLGCHCKLGLLREPATGRCLTPQECQNASSSYMTTPGHLPPIYRVRMSHNLANRLDDNLKSDSEQTKTKP